MMVHEALESAFANHRRLLFDLAYRITGLATDAEDIVQETFARALSRPPADLDATLRPWLVRVAANLSRDALRRRKARRYFGPWLPEPLEDEVERDFLHEIPEKGLGPEARYSLAESATFAFLCALEALTPKERTVLVLRDVMGLEPDETAEMLSTSPGNIRVVHHRARRKLDGYDADRRIPDEPLRERTRQALTVLLTAIANGEPASVARLLSDDCVLETDAAGEFQAAVVRVSGKDRIALTEIGIAARTVVRSMRLASINGLPGIVFEFEVQRLRQAPRAVFLIDLAKDGRIRAIRSVLASQKVISFVVTSNSV
jgi:RNA polymerase sigma-70 factor (ECF subfamily)